MSQCWVSPGTGGPPPHALTQLRLVLADVGTEALGDVRDRRGAVAERAGLARGAGQFDRRRQLQRSPAASSAAVPSVSRNRMLDRSGGPAPAGGEQVVVHLHDELAAGLHGGSRHRLEERLAGARGPGVDPRPCRRCRPASPKQVQPSPGVSASLGGPAPRARARSGRRWRGARCRRSGAGTGCRSGTPASVSFGSITKQRYRRCRRWGDGVYGAAGEVHESLAGPQRRRRCDRGGVVAGARGPVCTSRGAAGGGRGRAGPAGR